MPLTIEFTEAEEKLLGARAATVGKTAAVYVRELVARDLKSLGSFDEILAPIRKEFAESGMTEAEWDELIEQAREEVWQEQQGKKS